MEFEDIYRKYWNKIFRLCMGYVNDYSLAQDMAQETFIKVWQYLPTFRNEANIDTWIFRIATNNCLRQLERKKQILSTQFPADLFEDEKTDIEPQIQLLYKFIAELSETKQVYVIDSVMRLALSAGYCRTFGDRPHYHFAGAGRCQASGYSANHWIVGE